MSYDPSEQRFVPCRFKGDDAHPERKMCFGVIAEDWRYKFIEKTVEPGDEGLLLVQGDPPFEVEKGWVLVKVGEGPGVLAEEGDPPVGYWVPIDPAFVEATR